MTHHTNRQSRAWPRWLYSAALYALSPLIWRRVWRESHADHPRRERLGFIPVRSSTQPVIWLHAASVGEVLAARPLIEGMRERYSDYLLIITTMTATGAERGRSLFKGEVGIHFVALDFPGSAQRFVARLRPELAIFFETELWPNLLHACHCQDVPVAIVNGRLSLKAMRGYRRIRALIHEALINVDWLAAKSPQDAERFQQLGMPSERITVVGSLKFDVSVNDDVLIDSKCLRTLWGGRPVWIAGSTHPGEDEQVLAAHSRVRNRYPSALLILVPRHPQRFDDVAKLCLQRGERIARRSRGETVDAQTTVYLGDTMGELMLLYGAADIAFVGGSLVPIGGHNLLEPAALGVPVISGPALSNFSDVAELLHEAEALIEVPDAEALGETVSELLAADDRRHCMSGAGLATIDANRGALQRTLSGLNHLLRNKQNSNHG